ncbi:helix-turn-helix domain-containing protein [Fructilactobacillus fructivorans]|uniref:helix-turn-helix domain-containing protein n=1 Tax=Fructilactobacillus fructivorans TaxID=1614 RepID=UPI00223AFFC5|nr:helix-turn-helix domain-containing protein [Fructilactobacillus fructivorans]MCT0151217.1 helix-turn-helix domain-containing protein [Fructilactobacillus fructivorans]MCT2867706.1 helix-turn-helix domain-containing protein [Fructilactobacillus fructivorans]MCT2868776.1 helix-turn-helix domain-containing protein [Fructilactobacillus fructivorans]MCT2874054.1 helix-turn-helix domain-containing protein [Fructilactobacillus fructivorans]
MDKEDKNQKSVNIGQLLRKARVDAGMSIDDVQKKTKIQKRYLEAIEEDNFAALPGDFYVRAFVKQFADAVGLNGSEFIQKYDQDLPGGENANSIDNESREGQNYNGNQPEPAQSQQSSQRTARHDPSSPEPNHSGWNMRKLVPIVGIVIIVVIIIGVIWVGAGKLAHHNSNSASSTTSVSVSSDSYSSKASSSSKQKAAEDKAKAKSKNTKATGTQITKGANENEYNVKTNEKETKVNLKGTAKSWSAVSVNGSQVWQGTLNPNQTHEVTIPANSKDFNVNLGNATATDITINGQKANLEKPANNGSAQVRNVTFKLTK